MGKITKAENVVWDVIFHIDQFSDGVLAGWAHTPANESLVLYLEVNSQEVLVFKADDYREDLKVAGKAEGMCSFIINYSKYIEVNQTSHISLLAKKDALTKVMLSEDILISDSSPTVEDPQEAIKGHFDGYDSSTIWGWAYSEESNEPLELILSINEEDYLTLRADKFREDLKEANFNDGISAFNAVLDFQNIVHNFGGDAVLRIKESITRKEISNSPQVIAQPELRWGVDVYSDDTFAGWVVDVNNENLQLKLNVYIDDKLTGVVPANFERTDLLGIGIENCNHGFHINFAQFSNGKNLFRVRIEIEYDKTYLIGEEKEMFSFQGKIKELTDLQTYLREQQYDSIAIEKDRLVKSIIPGLIDLCREQRQVPVSSMLPISVCVKQPEIAIVVPIYKGVEETLNCLNSVLQSNNQQSYRLIAINDCGPEAEMQPALEALANDFNFELLYNEDNLGFVGTVNRGMKLSVGHDVILLNSDTVVPNGWLDAIASVAASSPTIGTVTPISNNATICSYPNFCLDNELPNGYDVNQLAELCADNIETPVELPTAHGYCMFIKRETLDEVGYFDEQKWGKGYAEENDFSLRSSKLGWKHVVTNKTFVHHLGSVSFAEDTEGFIATNLEKLNGMYPDYPMLVQKFIHNDPVRKLRKELGKKLLKAELETGEVLFSAKGKSILFVSLTIGGGTKVATDDLAKLLNEEGQSVFMLTTKDNKIWELSSHIDNATAQFDIRTERDELIAFLKDLDVWHIHYHHVLEFGKSVWDLPKELGCEYDVTLHDYFSICPRVNFLTTNNVFCGEPDEDGCRKCLNEVGVHDSSFLRLNDVGGDITDWRAYFNEKLSGARKVITPSKDTKTRIETYIPLTNVEALYHPENVETISIIKEPKLEGESINIGFIGAIGPHKGLQVIKDLAEEISQSGRNIKITVVGYTSDDTYFDQYDFVSITGRYNQAELKEIMSENKIDVIFLASIWPETFGYTYSEVIRLGYPVVSFNHGAIVERSVGVRAVKILDLNDSIACIIEDIESLLREKFKFELEVGLKYSSVLENYYN